MKSPDKQLSPSLSGRKKQSFLERLSPNGFPYRAMLLIALAGLPACSQNEEIDTVEEAAQSAQEELQVSMKSEKGEWRFQFFERKVMNVTVDDRHGRTLYHFIRGELRQQGHFLGEIPSEDELAIIDAIIFACRQLNPGVNLDDFSGLNGQSIKYPSLILMEYSHEHLEDSYSRLQDVAELDGYVIDSTSGRSSTYQRANESGLAVGDGQGYKRAQGYEESPALMNEQALARFQSVAQRFYKDTDGWSLTYTHVLRTEALQKKQRNGVMNTTHYTGGTIDITDGRFITPDGQEITWSSHPEYRDKIEDTFRPLLEHYLLEGGAMVFPEPRGGHYHVYFPQSRFIDLSSEAQEEIIITPEPEKRKKVGVDRGTINRLPANAEQNEVNDHLWSVIQDLAGSEEPVLSDPDMQRQVDALKDDFDLSGFKAKRWILTILSTNFYTEGLVMTRVETGLSVRDLQERIDNLSRDRQANQELITRFVQVRNQKIYLETVRIVNQMTPEQSRFYRPLLGTTLDNPRKVNYSDLEATWKWKSDKRSFRKDRNRGLYTHTQNQLAGRSNSVTMEDWSDMQLQACNLFQQYGESMGYDTEMLPYITPALVLAVTNAEFASEFQGAEYTNISPAIFHDQNLVFGPAGNDNYYSAGVVQMITDTQEEIMGRSIHRIGIYAIQDELPEYGLILPAKANGEYNAEQQAMAQLTHVPSQLFYGSLAIAYHIERAFNTLMADSEFKASWDRSTYEDRTIFMAALAAMSINKGRGGGNNTAKSIVKLPARTTLAEYTTALGQVKHNGSKTGRRGATTGEASMRAMMSHQVD